jgi:tRNA (guanine37-N1)-methyltransferase
MFESVLSAGMLGRARQAGLFTVDFVNPRDFTSDRHRTVDDAPYGGGPGMVMKVEPLMAAIEGAMSGEGPAPHRVLLSPVGAPLTQRRVRELAKFPHITLVCGRYEGIDQRVAELGIDEELSLGDFVLTGGELAAMAVIDAVARYVPGVLGEPTSKDEESFSESLLEYPQYTRPARFRDLDVPEVLLSGNHARIAQWRREQSLRRTAERRPDLLSEHRFTDLDRTLWRDMGDADLARRTYVALVHHPVYDRNHHVVTSAVTNLDIHDIARSSATYGLAGYYMVTPVATQRDKVDSIIGMWSDGIVQTGADNRIDALTRVHTAPSIAGVTEAVTREWGCAPRRVATSARAVDDCRALDFESLRHIALGEKERPLLILFGTGWGLSDEVIHECDQVLVPICGMPEFNHLSVRSAVAVIVDRLFGMRGGCRT